MILKIIKWLVDLMQFLAAIVLTSMLLAVSQFLLTAHIISLRFEWMIIPYQLGAGALAFYVGYYFNNINFDNIKQPTLTAEEIDIIRILNEYKKGEKYSWHSPEDAELYQKLYKPRWEALLKKLKIN